MNLKDIIDIDRQHIWHPFTQMKDYAYRQHPIIVKAKGIKLYDINGKAYYDTISSWWTNILGHCHPFINRAIKKQLDLLEHVNFSGFTHLPAVQLVLSLRDILHPSLSRFFFSDNGSTAVEVAIKMAFQYWRNKGDYQRDRFIFLDNAYHGDTLGAVSIGGIGSYHSLFKPLLFKAYKSDSPNCSACKYRKGNYTLDASDTGCQIQCFDAMQNLIIEHSERLCAVVVEPILQGAAGMLVYPAKYLQRLRQLTEQLGILLIYDEVATGFGRTGKMFAYQHSDTIPDIICLSKGITGGYLPLALTVTREHIFQAFYDDYEANKTFFHGHSYTANAIACATAKATIDILKNKNLPYSNISLIQHLREMVKTFADFDFIADIRHIGFVAAFDIVKKNGMPFSAKERIGFKIYQRSLEEGLVLRPLGDTIYYFLPLTITLRQVNDIVKKTKKVLIDVIGG